MSKLFTTGALFAALISQVAGHTAVRSIKVGGKTYEGFYQGGLVDPGNQSPAWWTAQGWGWDPVMGSALNSPDIIAHKSAKPSPYTAEAQAGSDVTFTWFHEWDRANECAPGSETGWDCSHHGWTATYLAKCPGNCKDVDKTSLEFFKIHEVALIDYRNGRFSQSVDGAQGYTGYWGTDEIFYKNNNQQTVTIPKDIPEGNYVLRTEVASLHNNGGIQDIQFWPQAFNVHISSSSKQPLPKGTRGQEIYNSNNKLLNWNLYMHAAGATVATAPGPQLASIASANTSSRRHARDFSA